MPSTRRLPFVFFALCFVSLDVSHAEEETLQSLSDKVETLTELGKQILVHIQSNLDISNSDISNSAKFEASF